MKFLRCLCVVLHKTTDLKQDCRQQTYIDGYPMSDPPAIGRMDFLPQTHIMALIKVLGYGEVKHQIK